MKSFPRRPAPARARFAAAAFALLLVAPAADLGPARAQSLDLDRERSRQMLRNIKGELKKNYYDPTFRGVDIEARFKAADDKLRVADSRTSVQMSSPVKSITILPCVTFASTPNSRGCCAPGASARTLIPPRGRSW